MAREHLIPGPDHPITITPTGERVRVTVAGHTVADTTNALTLQEASYRAVQYVPLADVDPAVMRRTDTSTYCPFKGDASYYSVVPAGKDGENAVWTYEEPYDAVADIREYVAFYPNKVSVEIITD